MSSILVFRKLGLAILTLFALATDRADALSKTPVGGSGGLGTVVITTTAPETPPAAPHEPGVGNKTSSTISLGWTDYSAAESGYRIERQDGSVWKVVAELPPIGGAVIGFSGNYTVRGLGPDTQYCFRIVPWNSVGATPVPSVCARTTRVAGPITVVVDDLGGLQGELADLTPLPYRPTEVSDGPTAQPAPPAFPVPAARKIIYVADSAVIRIPSYVTLQLQQGVHLMSGRRGLVQGALLYSDTLINEQHLLEIRGNGVRVSGLRFRGPTNSTDQELPATKAIVIKDALDVVIDHNEFYDWTAAGVSVAHEPRATYDDPRPITFDSADRVRITENYFHDNQRQNLGYGVVVELSSYAYIDKNTFDYNRHAIASTGGRGGFPKDEDDNPLDASRGPEHGYRAYLNLVLPGHLEQYWSGPGTWQTHSFDVHGLETSLGRDYYGGWAGELIDVANNSFLDIQGTALNVRGTPVLAAYFHDNATPALVPLQDQWIGLDGGNSYYGWYSVNSQSDEDNVYVYDNVPAPDPRAELGVGDFDGDGRADVFLATGQAWYYSSGGISEWRYLNQSKERLYALALTDYDHDGRTDVLIRWGSGWMVSWSGSGPLQLLGATTVSYPTSFYDRTTHRLVGDFTGDGVVDQLSFDPDGDRYFRIINGANGARVVGRHPM